MLDQALNRATPAATLNEQMAAYAHAAAFEDLGPEVVQRAKEVILYHLALALRGRRDDDPMGAQAIGAARRFSPHGGPATIIGTPYKAMPIDAAFANCTQMRAYGLDDVIFPAGIHAGLVTIPVTLAVAEERARSGRDVLTAIVVAYEVMGKLGLFSWDSAAPRRPTMAYGTFGSAIAAGLMLGLTREQLGHAIAYAAHGAQGLGESDLGPVSHYYSLVCRAGITGAVLAQEGGIGSRTVMEGRFGFFDTFVGNRPFDAQAFCASLGHDFQIMGSVEKRYPGTGLNIIAIEAAREIVAAERLQSQQVREVRVFIPEERRNFGAGHSSGPFTSEISTPSSVAYQIGMILLDGELDFRRYAQFTDRTLLAAVAKVKPVLVPGKSNIRWTRVEFELTDGRTVAREAEQYEFPPIAPFDRLSAAAEGFLGSAQIARLFEIVMRLDREQSVAPLMDCLVPGA
jgi:2-methylcitrate dehydratase PrpD